MVAQPLFARTPVGKNFRHQWRQQLSHRSVSSHLTQNTRRSFLSFRSPYYSCWHRITLIIVKSLLSPLLLPPTPPRSYDLEMLHDGECFQVDTLLNSNEPKSMKLQQVAVRSTYIMEVRHNLPSIPSLFLRSQPLSEDQVKFFTVCP